MMEKNLTGSAQDRSLEHRSQVNIMIAKATHEYYEGVLSAGEKETCLAVVNKLLSDQGRKLPEASSIKELCQRFASFSQIKITLLSQEKIQYQQEQEGPFIPRGHITVSTITAAAGVQSHKRNLWKVLEKVVVNRLLKPSPQASNFKRSSWLISVSLQNATEHESCTV